MQNLNKSEKSRGVVVFAFNSQTVDYVSIADQTSKLIAKNLDLPITLITDPQSQPRFQYDKIIKIENTGNNFRTDKNGKNIEWKNFGRYFAYQLSPYTETLLLDTDYLVLDNTLNKFWSVDFDYLIVKDSVVPEGRFENNMGYLSHNWLWATVVFFKKTKKSELFFNFVGRIQKNYSYFKTLYNLEGTYRNDYSFAIADMVLNGYSVDSKSHLPFNMITIANTVKSIEVKNNGLLIRESDRAVLSPKQNLHIMDKEYLLSSNFKRFVQDVTA